MCVNMGGKKETNWWFGLEDMSARYCSACTILKDLYTIFCSTVISCAVVKNFHTVKRTTMTHEQSSIQEMITPQCNYLI